MLRWLGRIVLLRVLPRRLVPLLAAVEVFNLLKGLRRGSAEERDARERAPGPARRRPPVR